MKQMRERYWESCSFDECMKERSTEDEKSRTHVYSSVVLSVFQTLKWDEHSIVSSESTCLYPSSGFLGPIPPWTTRQIILMNRSLDSSWEVEVSTLYGGPRKCRKERWKVMTVWLIFLKDLLRFFTVNCNSLFCLGCTLLFLFLFSYQYIKTIDDRS